MEGEPADRDDGASLEAMRVELAPAERELLIKVCTMYRCRLPTYLRSARPELELVEGILKKIG